MFRIEELAGIRVLVAISGRYVLRERADGRWRTIPLTSSPSVFILADGVYGAFIRPHFITEHIARMDYSRAEIAFKARRHGDGLPWYGTEGELLESLLELDRILE